MSSHCPSFPSRRRAAGFSLIELLTVMAIVAMLSVLTAPALSSLKGRGLVQGGNMVADLAQQARQNAMTRGVLTAMVLVNSGGSADRNNRSFVLLELKPDSSSWDPVTRWMHLPDGVVVDSASSSEFTASPPVPVGLNLPKLNGQNVPSSECVFQVFTPRGGLLDSATPTTAPPRLLLAEGSGGVAVPNAPNYYDVVINRFTGLVKVDRP